MLTIPPDVAEANSGLIAAVDDAVALRGPYRGSLIPVLQDLRARHLPLDGTAMQLVADRLGIPPVEVFGVVSFYSFLGPNATGTHTIRLCRTGSSPSSGPTASASATPRPRCSWTSARWGT
jgi:NADH:ubiquinone oxidoreductase subunit E